MVERDNNEPPIGKYLGRVMVTGERSSIPMRDHDQRQLLAGHNTVLCRRQRNHTKFHLTHRFEARRPHGCSERWKAGFSRNRDETKTGRLDKRRHQAEDAYKYELEDAHALLPSGNLDFAVGLFVEQTNEHPPHQKCNMRSHRWSAPGQTDSV
jgi:hypothetical protein